MKFDFDIAQVADNMLQAALPHLSKGGQQVSSFASHEFKQFITNIEHVQTMVEEKKYQMKKLSFL